MVVHVAGRRVQHYRGKPWRERQRETKLVFIAKEGSLDEAVLTRELQACRWRERQDEAFQPKGASSWAERFTSMLRSSR